MHLVLFFFLWIFFSNCKIVKMIFNFACDVYLETAIYYNDFNLFLKICLVDCKAYSLLPLFNIIFYIQNNYLSK